MSYRGSVKDIVFHNARTSWSVLAIRMTSGDFSMVTGVYPDPKKGDVVEIEGQEVRHPKYGEQIQASSIHRVKPRGYSEVVTYLSHLIPGIGNITASAIVDKYGVTDTIEAILARPEDLDSIVGVGDVRREAIVKAIQADEEDTPFRKLVELGLTPAQAAAAKRHFGEELEAAVMENPYRLTDVPRITFPVADNVARSMGVDIEDERRLIACAKHVTALDAGYGNTWMEHEEAAAKIAKLLGADMADAYTAIRLALDQGQVVSWNRRLYSAEMWEMERSVAADIRRLSQGGGVMQIVDPDAVYSRLGVTPSVGQRAAVDALAKSQFAVVTGPPGTGKTTIVKAVVLGALACDLKVALAAPTGKAAKRLSELAGHPASTIHRLLGAGSDDMADRHNQLPVDLVIVDEASMLSLEVADMLFQAIPTGAGVLLVGDVDQLPSVGPGNVLGDVIAAEWVPVIRLDVIHRQAEGSPIITAAQAIHTSTNAFHTCEYLRGLDKRGFDVVTFEDTSVAYVVRRLQKEFDSAMKGEGIESIQVMAPMRKGDVGVVALNTIMADYVNPDDEGRRHKNLGGFMAGDRVMHVVNNYRLAVFNGMTGMVVGADNKYVSVKYDDRVVEYDMCDVSELILSFVTTIHKCQGSEVTTAVVIAHPAHSYMLTRQLVYTAITRAKKRCVVITCPGMLEAAVANRKTEQRKTSLTLLLVSGEGEEIEDLDVECPPEDFTDFTDFGAGLPF